MEEKPPFDGFAYYGQPSFVTLDCHGHPNPWDVMDWEEDKFNPNNPDFVIKHGRRDKESMGMELKEEDVKTLQEEVAKKAGEAAAKAANPFQAVNPLGTVEANPFEKAKKVLNPFQ